MMRFLYISVAIILQFQSLTYLVNPSLAQDTALSPTTSVVPPVSTQTKFWDRILIDNNPYTAESFLKNNGPQSDLKSRDLELYRNVFARATELKDIADLLHGLAEPRAIRMGLEARNNCVFCQKPPEFLTWMDLYFKYFDDNRKTVVRQALWEWGDLKSEHRDWLLSQGETLESWSRLNLGPRREKLQVWADSMFAQMMKENPKDITELKDYRNHARQLTDMLDNNQRSRLWERVGAVESAVHGLADAQKRLAHTQNPQLQSLLTQAQNAPDLDTKLILLNRVFDGLGVRNEAVRAAAPPREGQTFDDSRRAVVAGALATGLMREIRGTWAGDELEAFYVKNKLNLQVSPIPNANWIGQHQGGIITFNEEFIQEYIKGRGRDIQDILTDPQLLRGLTIELTPLFVHESTHYRQFVWAKERGISHLRGQHLELEAMQTEALFIIEKSKRDPSFKTQLESESSSSLLARESLNKAQRMLKNGPAYFRDTINARHYPTLLSLEGQAWSHIARHRSLITAITAEFNRRSKLPPEESRALDHGPDFSEHISDQKQWDQELKSMGTPHLERLIQVLNKRDTDDEPARYAAYRERLNEFNRMTEKRLNKLLSEKYPRKTRHKGLKIPSPLIE